MNPKPFFNNESDNKKEPNTMKLIAVILVLIAATVIFLIVQNTTMPSGLGVKNGQLSPVPKSPNAVSSQTSDEKKKVEPLPFKGDLRETKDAVKRILRTYGNIEIQAEEINYLHAVSTTPTMRFHDDLEFYFDEKAGLVHIRSASRTGYSDMGLNRERYKRLTTLYQTKQGK